MAGQSTTKFELAYLEIEAATAGGATEKVNCWFNPTTLAVNRKVNWDSCTTIAASVQQPTYQGGVGDDISLNLLLHAEDDRTSAQVDAYIKTLFGLLDATVTDAGTGQSRPRTLQLHWGKYVSEVSIVRSVDVTIELFEQDGTPVRATANLVLSQYEPGPGQADAESQNPTTRATQARRAHRVHGADNVHMVAYRHLKDPARWLEVAEANDLDDPLAIRPGDLLVVPLEAT